MAIIKPVLAKQPGNAEALNTLGEYEQELYTYLAANAPDIFDTLKEKEAIDDALDAKIQKTLTDFTNNFKGSKGL